MKKRGQRDFHGKRIIMCNGVVVPSAEYNFEGNHGKALCTCGRIVLHHTWKKHINAFVCMEYHRITNTIPTWEFVNLTGESLVKKNLRV